MSHNDQKVLDDMAQIILKEFGDMEISRGELYQFLGMEIEVNGGKVGLSMKRQLNEISQKW